jgi:hypothetical protein
MSKEQKIESPHAVILVDSTHHAVRIEKLLKKKGIECKMIPVPRQLSSDCGACVRISRSDIEGAKGAIATAKAKMQGIHEI